MFNFFDPGEVIKKYYFNYFINLHNKASSSALILAEKIQELRNNAKNFFLFNEEDYLSFQPNQDYINLLLDKHFDFSEYIVFTDEPENPFFNCFKKVKSICFFNESDLAKISKTENSFVWISKLETFPSPEAFLNLKKINKKLFVFVVLDYLIYEKNKKFMQCVDFFSFNSSYSLDVNGINLFGFRAKYQIEPVYLGSSSVSNVFKKEYKVAKLPESIEIGTANYPSLLVLERYFYFLKNQEKEVFDKLEELKVNTNNFYKESIFDKKYLINYNFPKFVDKYAF